MREQYKITDIHNHRECEVGSLVTRCFSKFHHSSAPRISHGSQRPSPRRLCL